MTESSEKFPFVIQITREGMGSGDLELQKTLIQKYLTLIEQSDLLPSVISFYTDGVKVAVEGSHVLDELAKLEARGVRLVLCGTCLDHYGLFDKVKVGIMGGMTDIIEAQWRAEKLITL